MALDEYLEKLAAEGYRQQLADEENVPRSLPFFATSLAVLVAILGAIKEWIPAPSWALYPIAIWTLLLLFGVALLVVIVALGLAVRSRKFRYIMDEAKLATYVDELRNYYELDPDLSEDERQTATVADLRAALTRQYGDAAMYNRALNSRRVGARATAFEALVFALLVAFILVATILPGHGHPGDPDVGDIQGQDRECAQPGKPDGCSGSRLGKAGGPAVADHQKGRLVVPGPALDAGPG